MSIRIYALAKQLKLESKKLVDICKGIGITGKGSALASLTDEEVEQVKQHLGGASKSAGPQASGDSSQAPPMMRKPAPAPSGRVPVLKRKPTAKQPPEPPPSESDDVSPPSDETPASTEPAQTPEPPSVSVTPTTPTGSVRREDYVGPAATANKKIPDLGAARKKSTSDSGEGDTPRSAPARPSGPTIKLAPMPSAPQPSKPAAKSNEPAPQKPDIRLPPDAIRASKAGSKPLSEHLRKHEKKRKAAARGRDTEVEDAGSAKETRGRFGKQGGARRGGKEDTGLGMGGREQRQLKRKRAAGRRRRGGDMEEDAPRFQPRRLRRTGNVNTAAPRKSSVVVEMPCTVKVFAEAVGVPVSRILGKAMELGNMLTINADLDLETAELLAESLGVDVSFREAVSLEDQLITAVEEQEDASETLKPRPPVITFLGHVDHGKTSLLDRIIDIDVVSGEKGGITQHIRAYRLETENGPIAFVDTPGHEAFTEMRARGANCTDIAVLVVAADDGVMPQTEEAISHARAAGVPIVVALNKIDLPGVNVDRAMQDLAANELLPSEWGGDTEVVRTSATTGEGISELLETLLTVAELHEYSANPDRLATGVCLEAEVQQGRGVVAKVLVERGTLSVGDVVVCGPAHGRVKAMYDTLKPSKRLKKAGPSTPVNLTGLDVVPGAGDRFHCLENISEARAIANQRADASRTEQLSGGGTHVTLENLFDRLGGRDEVQTLNVILRCDVRGSIEAIRKELTKLDHPEVQVKILQASVGGITEADVHLADASDAIIIGFSVVPEEGARILADRKGVQIRRYDIIYKLTEDLKAALEGMLRPEERESELGRALVQRTFTISRVGTVAGCRVLAGNIQRDARVRVIRDNRIVGDYPLDSLRREKDDSREVREGYECGIKLKGFNDLKEGDLLEAYKIEEVARTF